MLSSFGKSPVPIFCWNPPRELSDAPWTALRTSSFPATRTVTWNPNPASSSHNFWWRCVKVNVREVSGVKFNNFSKTTLGLLWANKSYEASWVCPMLPFKLSRSYMTSLRDIMVAEKQALDPKCWTAMIEMWAKRAESEVHEIKSQTHPCSGPLPLWRL